MAKRWSIASDDTIAGLGTSLGRKTLRGELQLDEPVHAQQTFELQMDDGRHYVGHLRVVFHVDILTELTQIDAAPPPRED